MIYLDTSVALARLFGETRRPSSDFWDQHIASCRLLHYEIWTRIHAGGQTASLAREAELLLGKVVMIDLSADALSRALNPFPVSVRTLDALHLATMEYIRGRRVTVSLASYDLRMLAAAEALGIQAASV